MEGHSLPTRYLDLQPQNYHHQPNKADDSQSDTRGAHKRRLDDLLPAGEEAEISTHRRPVGSQNKPKPPIIITQNNTNALRTHVVEVPDGCDIVDTLAAFSRSRQIGVCIMSGTGSVAKLALRQPAAAAAVALHGRFEILSLSGSFLPPPAPPAATGLTVYLGGRQGQVLGGSVVGQLIAAGPVIIIAASFSKVSYERLPLEEEEEEAVAGIGQQQAPPPGRMNPRSQPPEMMADPFNVFQGMSPNPFSDSNSNLPNNEFWATGRLPF